MGVGLDSLSAKELQIVCGSSDVESNSEDKGEIFRILENPQRRKQSTRCRKHSITTYQATNCSFLH